MLVHLWTHLFSLFQFWVNDLHVGSDLKGGGTHIAASDDFMAFIHDSKCNYTLHWVPLDAFKHADCISGVGGFAVLPLSSHGRFQQFPIVSGHSGAVTDFSFSPFHSELLASGGEDCVAKVWKLPEEFPLDARFSSPVETLGPLEVWKERYVCLGEMFYLCVCFFVCVESCWSISVPSYSR